MKQEEMQWLWLGVTVARHFNLPGHSRTNTWKFVELTYTLGTMKLEKGERTETNFQTRDLGSQRNQWTIFICLIQTYFWPIRYYQFQPMAKVNFSNPHKFITNYLNTDFSTVPQSAPTKGQRSKRQLNTISHRRQRYHINLCWSNSYRSLYRLWQIEKIDFAMRYIITHHIQRKQRLVAD